MTAAAMALAGLRLRLNRGLWLSQLALDGVAPVAFALFAAHLAGPDSYARIPPAAAIMAATNAMLRGPAFQLSSERIDGTRDLLVAAGASRGDYLAAHALAGLYGCLFPILAYATTALALAVALPASPVYWVGLLLFLAVAHGAGTVLGSLFSSLGPLALVSNIVVVVSAAVCPVLYPAERVPLSIATTVRLLPPSLAAQLAEDGVRGTAHSAAYSLIVLAAWAAALLALGYALLPWRRR